MRRLGCACEASLRDTMAPRVSRYIAACFLLVILCADARTKRSSASRSGVRAYATYSLQQSSRQMARTQHKAATDGKHVKPELLGRCQHDASLKELYKGFLFGGCGGFKTVDGFPSSLPEEAVSASLQNLGGLRVKRLVEKLQAGKPITVVALGGSVSTITGGCWNHGGCVPACADCVPTCQLQGVKYPYPGCCDGKTNGYQNGCLLITEKLAYATHGRWMQAYQAFDPEYNKIWNRETSPVSFDSHISEFGRPLYQSSFSRFMQYINETFPHPGHVLYNSANSGWGAIAPLKDSRLQHRDKKVDLYILEHNINRWNKNGTARAMRHYLSLEEKPAVVLLNLALWGSMREPPPASMKELNARWGAAPQPESEAHELAVEYRTGSVALRPAILHMLRSSWPPPAPVWPLSKLYIVDGTHHNYDGPAQIYIGELLINWLRTAAARPRAFTDNPAAETSPDLVGASALEVLYRFKWSTPGAEPELVATYNTVTSYVPEQYRVVPNAIPGWFRVSHPADGPPEVRECIKPGLLSVAYGGEALLRLLVGPNTGTSSVKAILVSYMASYSANMGVIKFECLEGCTCKTQHIDTLIGIRYSGEESVSFPASDFGPPGDSCLVRVTNVAEGVNVAAERKQRLQDPAGSSKVKLVDISLTSGDPDAVRAASSAA